MKKLMKALLLFTVATVLSAFPVLAETVTLDDVTYSLDVNLVGKTVTIRGITIADTVIEPMDLVIPSEITYEEEQYSVAGIYPIAASEADKIKSVSFAGEVPMIHGNLYPFKDGTVSATKEQLGVESATTSMGELPGNMPEVPAYITDNYNYDSNHDGIMDTYYAGENLVRLDPAYTGDFKVKDGTVSILAGAMEECSGLGAVTIPDSVEWIGIRAFANSSVTSVNLPKGMLTEGSGIIQAWTFYGCSELKSVTFPEGEHKINRITHMAFTGCSSLEGFDFTRVNSIDTSTFIKAFAKGVEIDLSKTQIAGSSMAFSHSGIGKVILGETAKNLPFELFRNCTSLTTVEGMEFVGTVNAWAFSGCKELKDDILAESKVTYLAHRSFADTGMTEITIPETVTSINGGVFAGNEQLITLNWKAAMNSNTPLFALLNDMPKANFFYQGTVFTMSKAEKDCVEYTFPKELNIYAQVTFTYGFFTMMQYLETVNYCYEVSEIPFNTFAFCPNLNTVTFAEPEKLISIGNGAFMGCLSLKNFPFDKLTELKSIGQGAFMIYGTMLDGVSIGDTMTPQRYENLTDAQKDYGFETIDLSNCAKLTSIDTGAFLNQYSATSVHLPESLNLEALSSTGTRFGGTVSMKDLTIDGAVNCGIIAWYFHSEDYNLTNAYHTGLETVTLNGDIVPMSSDVSEIPMFHNMEGLKTVNITKSEYIPRKCFMECSALETVNMPNAKEIGDWAFMKSGLEAITLNDGAQYGQLAFFECKNLKSVVVGEDTIVGDYAFLRSGLETAEIKSGAQLGKYTFLECTDLKNAVVGEDTIVGDYAFLKSGLETAEIKSGTQLGKYTFMECTDLKDVTFEEGVSQISDYMFMGCSSLTSVTAPDVTIIGDFAFARTGLTEAAIVEGVTYGNGVFSSCTSLEKVVVEEGVTELTSFLFEKTTALKDVALPSTLEIINWGAFKDSAGCTINIPEAVATIEDDAFCGGAFGLILNGAPIIETEHDGDETLMFEELNVDSIGAKSVFYYTDEASKTAAELYVVNVNPENDSLIAVPTVKILPPADLTVVVTGTPKTAEAGKTLDLSQFKVTYNDIELTEEQYELDYDSKDKTLGERTVTAKITDTDIILEGYESHTISVNDFAGEIVTGDVCSFTDPTKVMATFVVDVVDHYHIPKVLEAVAPTCTESGLTEGKGCSLCDIVLEKQETVAAKGHTEVIDKEVEATCTEEGLTEGKHCSVCNTVLEKQEVVKAAGHTFGEWTVVKEATQEEEGLEERVCTKCNEKEQQTIDKLPVTPTPEPTPDPTPTPEPTPTPFENPFKDVTEADWYYKSVMWGAENKVVAGVTADMFAPMASCTRAQIVTFLWRAAGKPEAAIDTCTFKDVDATAYYYKAMLWGTENKIISGYNTETFAPDATCTRAELVTFLWRIDGFTTVENVENTFTDVSENDWFYKAVLWAKEEGITSGYTPTTCAPNMQVTRAETVAMLYRYYN